MLGAQCCMIFFNTLSWYDRYVSSLYQRLGYANQKTPDTHLSNVMHEEHKCSYISMFVK